MGILQVYYFDPVENIYVVVFKGEKGEILAFSHCRGQKFETSIAHQKFPNEIKHLEETLGAFSLVQSSMVWVDYFSWIFRSPILGFGTVKHPHFNV